MKVRLPLVLILSLTGVLPVGRVASAQAQDGFAWTRATIVRHMGQTLTDGEANSLSSAGFDAVSLPADTESEAEWGTVTTAAHSAGLRIVLEIPHDLGEAVVDAWMNRAREAEFDGVLLPSAVAAASREESDGPGFVVLHANSPDSVGDGMHVGGLTDSHELEQVFVQRARTPDDPGAAPVAFAPGQFDARWLLLPGPVAGQSPQPDDDLSRTIAQFRRSHPAVPDGVHEQLSDRPYAFYRGLRMDRGALDEVVIVLGAEGKVRLNVSSVWPDDVILRDAVTGEIGLVSFGQVTLPAGPDGVLLIELLD